MPVARNAIVTVYQNCLNLIVILHRARTRAPNGNESTRPKPGRYQLVKPPPILFRAAKSSAEYAL